MKHIGREDEDWRKLRNTREGAPAPLVCGVFARHVATTRGITARGLRPMQLCNSRRQTANPTAGFAGRGCTRGTPYRRQQEEQRVQLWWTSRSQAMAPPLGMNCLPWSTGAAPSRGWCACTSARTACEECTAQHGRLWKNQLSFNKTSSKASQPPPHTRQLPPPALSPCLSPIC